MSENRGSQPDPAEDARLIQQIRAGHTESFGVLVRKYQDRVFNACWRICGHLEDARDLTQEAFLKAFDNLSSFRQQSGFYTWIYRVAVNLALTHRRNVSRSRVVSFDQFAGESGTQAEKLLKRVADRDKDSGKDVPGETDARACVLKALQQLDADHRAVVVLRDIEGFNYCEIAEILEVPAGTVKSRLHRARMQLREAIRPVLTVER